MVEALGLCRLLRRRIRGRGRVERRLSRCLGRSFGCVGLGVGLLAGAVPGIGLVVIGPGPGLVPGPGLEAVPVRTGLDVHYCSLPVPDRRAVESAVAPLEVADVVQGWKSGAGCSRVSHKRIGSCQSSRG